MSTLLNISNLTSRKLLTTAALAALFAVAGSHVGHARATSVIAGDGFSPSIIRVLPENGSWARIEERVLGLPVTVDITAPQGSGINAYHIFQKGLPDALVPLDDVSFNNAPEHHSSHRNLIGKTEWMTNAERQAVIAECNEKLQNGGDIHNTYNTFASVGVRLKTFFFSAPAIYDDGNVTVPVECVGAERRPAQAGAVTSATPDFKVKGIGLRFRTTLGYGQQVDADTKCKLTAVRVRVATTKAGPVRFKLWTKIGNAPMTSDVVDAWSSFAGPGKFEAVYTKAFPVTKTTNIQAKAEEMNNTFGLSTDWKEVTVPCKTDRGGFASTPTAPAAAQAAPLGLPGVIVDRPQPTKQGFFNAKATLKPTFQPTARPATKTAPVPGFRPEAPRPAFAKDRFQRSKVHF